MYRKNTISLSKNAFEFKCYVYMDAPSTEFEGVFFVNHPDGLFYIDKMSM